MTLSLNQAQTTQKAGAGAVWLDAKPPALAVRVSMTLTPTQTLIREIPPPLLALPLADPAAALVQQLVQAAVRCRLGEWTRG